jgi:hypothetical protein
VLSQEFNVLLTVFGEYGDKLEAQGELVRKPIEVQKVVIEL